MAELCRKCGSELVVKRGGKGGNMTYAACSNSDCKTAKPAKKQALPRETKAKPEQAEAAPTPPPSPKEADPQPQRKKGMFSGHPFGK
jgi:ssDNA-binding Zn-finger/Zn-ribbon topoisomerase 1